METLIVIKTGISSALSAMDMHDILIIVAASIGGSLGAIAMDIIKKYF